MCICVCYMHMFKCIKAPRRRSENFDVVLNGRADYRQQTCCMVLEGVTRHLMEVSKPCAGINNLALPQSIPD